MNNSKSLYLAHHGVMGMKWGIRRYQPYPSDYSGSGKYVGPKGSIQSANPYKAERSHKRRLAAATRNLKTAAKELAPAKEAYDKAYKEYNRTMNKHYFSKTKEEAERGNAKARYDRASRELMPYVEDLQVYAKVYNSFAKDYEKFVNRVHREYGNVSIEQMDTKKLSLGKDLAMSIYDTGLTIANLPIIGPKYTNAITKKAVRDARAKLSNISTNVNGGNRRNT